MRWIKVFFVLYAAAFMAVTLTRVQPWFSLQPDIPPLVPGIYLALLAIVSAVSVDQKRFPSRFWIEISYGLAAIWVAILAYPDIKAIPSRNATDYSGLVAILIVIASIIGSVWAAQVLLRRLLKDEKPVHQWIERSAPAVLLGVGALCVLASLTLTITPEGRGWQVLVGRHSWVTQTFNIFYSSSLGERFEWLGLIFGRTGRALYALGLISALLALLLLGSAKFSSEAIRRSRLLFPVTATNLLFSLYLLQDFYWGAYNGLEKKLWAALLGALCWLSTICFGIWLARRVASGSVQSWQLRALITFQLPFVAVLSFLFGDMVLIESQGLVLLVIGALVQNFGCMFLLTQQSQGKLSFSRTPDFSI
jgi:hypothetical protein